MMSIASRGDVSDGRASLPKTLRCQRYVGAPADPLRIDTLDVAVTHENEPRHRASHLGRSTERTGQLVPI